MSEFELQKACMDYVRIRRNYDERYWLVYAVPNANRRTPREQAQRKAEGMLAGVSDIIVQCPSTCGTYSSAALELKIGKNKPTKAQQEFLDRIARHGGYSKVIRAVDEFIYIMERYLATPSKNTSKEIV